MAPGATPGTRSMRVPSRTSWTWCICPSFTTIRSVWGTGPVVNGPVARLDGNILRVWVDNEQDHGQTPRRPGRHVGAGPGVTADLCLPQSLAEQPGAERPYHDSVRLCRRTAQRPVPPLLSKLRQTPCRPSAGRLGDWSGGHHHRPPGPPCRADPAAVREQSERRREAHPGRPADCPLPQAPRAASERGAEQERSERADSRTAPGNMPRGRL